GLKQHFSGLPVHKFAYGDCALKVSNADLDLGDTRLHQLLVERLGNALVSANQGFTQIRMLDLPGKLAVHQPFRRVPEKIAVAKRNPLDLEESAQHIFIGLDAQGAQENRAQELALAVDAHVENV